MKLRVALAGSFIGLACPIGAWAQEIPVALKGCYSSETTIIDRAADVVLGMTVTRNGQGDRTGVVPRQDDA
jgi:hypothetical protein